MEMLTLLVGLGLVAILALRFGYDSRPGFRAGDVRLVEGGRSPLDVEGDRRLALELREARRRSVGSTGAVAVKVDEAAFRMVGLSLTSNLSRAFAAALCRAATEERALGDGGWSGRAVDRLVRSVDVEHLCQVVEDLGLGQARLAGDRRDGGASETVRSLMVHVLRDRLQDALRIQAGLRPFWTWDGLADAGEPIVTTAEPDDGDQVVQRAAA